MYIDLKSRLDDMRQQLTLPYQTRVWYEGRLYRHDFRINTPEGTMLRDQFLEMFPNDTFVFGEDHCTAIGNVQGGIREPYENTTHSVYPFWIEIPQEALDIFQPNECFSDEISVLPWYGFKYDTVTGNKQLKISFRENRGIPATWPIPLGLPTGNSFFFGKIYYEGGESCNLMDYYVHCDQQTIKDFCNSRGLAYPIPEDYSVLTPFLTWGIVYDMNTLELIMVKAYEHIHTS